MSVEPDAGAFIALTERLAHDDPRLSPIGASIVAAAKMQISTDSRSFSRMFAIPHAIVLRELNGLADSTGKIRIVSRDARTMRSKYALADDVKQES